MSRKSNKAEIIKRLLLISSSILFLPMAALAVGWQEDQLRYQQHLADGEYRKLEKIEKKLLKTLKADWSETSELYYFYRGLAGKGLETEEQYSKRRQQIHRWQEETGSLTAQLVKAHLEYSYAWHLRGTDFAYNTLDESLDSYRTHLEIVKTLAEDLRPQMTKHVGFLDFYLDVGRIASWPNEKFDDAYAAAIAVQPDYFLFHASKLMYYLPRWHGSYDSYQQTLDQLQRDNDRYFGDRMYALLQHATRRGKMFENGEVDWQLFRDSFEAIIAADPVREARVKFAIHACNAEEWTDLNVLLDNLETPPTEEEWSPINFEFCRRYATRFNGALTIEQILETDSTILVPSKPVSATPVAQPEGDREKLAHVAGKGMQYDRVFEVVEEVARTNPNLFALLDELDIRLNVHDTYRMIDAISHQDVPAAIREVDRLEGSRYARKSREHLKSMLQMMEMFDSKMALVNFPVLWERGDVAQLGLSPEAVIELIEDEQKFGKFYSWLRFDVAVSFYLDSPEVVMEFLNGLPESESRAIATSVRGMLLSQQEYEQAIVFDSQLRALTDGAMPSLSLINSLGEDPIAIADGLGLRIPEHRLMPIVRSMATRNPRLASTYLDRIPAYRERVMEATRKHFKRRYNLEYDRWLQKNGEWISTDFKFRIFKDALAAKTFAQGVENEVVRERLLTLVGDTGPSEPVPEALAMIDLPDSRLQEDRIEVLVKVINRDPEAALDWFTLNAETVPLVSVSVVARMLFTQRLDILTWLQSFPDHPELTEVRGQVVRYMSMRHPRIVAGQLAEEGINGFADSHYVLAREWLKKDKASALKWIRLVTDSSDEHLFAQLARALIEQGEREEALAYADKVTDAAIRQEVVVAFVDQAASKEEFEEMADALGLSEIERERQRHRRYYPTGSN